MKFSVGLWIFGALSDRFSAYSDPASTAEKFARAKRVSGLNGVEMIYPAEFQGVQIRQVRDLLASNELKLAGLIADVFTDRKWVFGSLASSDAKLRKEAIEIVKRAMDASAELGSDVTTLWLGHDGYDYLFQVDYEGAWERLVEGVSECAEHNKNMRVALEHKLKEPRTHSFMGTVAKTLLLANAVGLENVGVTLDVGHALVSNETPAESAVLLSRYKKLYHVHLNDNFGYWDDDLIFGATHFWEFVELMFWLKRIGYEGWLSYDIFPYREDPIKSTDQSIKNTKAMAQIADKLDARQLERNIAEKDHAGTVAMLWKLLGD
jgi:xylose isomerase